MLIGFQPPMVRAVLSCNSRIRLVHQACLSLFTILAAVVDGGT
jgi:hypothetical protein